MKRQMLILSTFLAHHKASKFKSLITVVLPSSCLWNFWRFLRGYQQVSTHMIICMRDGNLLKAIKLTVQQHVSLLSTVQRNLEPVVKLSYQLSCTTVCILKRWQSWLPSTSAQRCDSLYKLAITQVPSPHGSSDRRPFIWLSWHSLSQTLEFRSPLQNAANFDLILSVSSC